MNIPRQKTFCETDDKRNMVKGAGPDLKGVSFCEISAVFSLTRWTPLATTKMSLDCTHYKSNSCLRKPRNSYNYRYDSLLWWSEWSCRVEWDPRGSTCVDGPWVSCLELCKFRDVKRSQWYLCKTIECLCFPLLDRKTLFEIMVMTIPAITVSIGQVCHSLDGPSRTQFILAHDGHERRFGDTSNCRTAGFVALTMATPWT